jgi:hypothetical protein
MNAVPEIDVSITLISCPACTREISVDADTCPQCGRDNSWVHPTLTRVIALLSSLDRDTRYEVKGHRMALVAQVQNTRQSFGSMLLLIAMVLLFLGVFVPPLTGLAFLCLLGAMILTVGGLSFSTRHELQIDLRQPGGTIGVFDVVFWADVVKLINDSVHHDVVTGTSNR